ncbi:MAG: hypothetical protein ACREOK_13240 [Gemmatimonadaceae bacterium]
MLHAVVRRVSDLLLETHQSIDRALDIESCIEAFGCRAQPQVWWQSAGCRTDDVTARGGSGDEQSDYRCGDAAHV